MTIRRLDAFFRTQITLDQPRFFNSITNLALAPLQRLVGQNHFKSLKDKISYVPQKTPAVPSGHVATLFKVVVFVCNFFVAIVLTPIGIAARHMSFRSPQIDRAYSLSLLLSIHTLEQTPELMKPAFAFLQKMTEKERNEFIGTSLPEDLALSYLSLPAYRNSAYAFLYQCSFADRNRIFNKLPPDFQGAYLALDTNAEFAEAYLRKIPDSKYSQLMPYLNIKLIEIYQAQKQEKEKKQALDKHLNTAIQSLESLENGLKAEDSDQISQLRNHSMYPFPFYLAKQVENDPKIVARADNALWKRFLSLKQSCLTFLSPDCDDALLETTRAQAKQRYTQTFKFNVGFFNTLKKNLESTMEDTEIEKWIEDQKLLDNYSYPFYTQPDVVECMEQILPPDTLKPISELFSSCLYLLQKRGLEKYTNEKPNENHEAVNALKKALDQLKTISNLQNLIKNQTT